MLKKAKILMAIPALCGGGAERVVTDLSCELVSRGWDVEVLSLYDRSYGDKKHIDKMKRSGVKIVFLDKHTGIDVSILMKIRKKVREINPSIIHTHTYACTPVAIAAAFLGKNKVHTVHNEVRSELPGHHRLFMYWQYRLNMCRPAAISLEVKKQVHEYYRLPFRKIALAYNGIDLSGYDYAEYRKRKKIYDFIFAGRLSRQKNPEMLVKAFAKVRNKIPNVNLCILGEGELRGDIERLVREEKIESCVYFQGFVDDVEEFYSLSKCFVISSRQEGFGLAIVEAMASGLPVIGTKTGAIPEIVRDGKDGILVGADDINSMARAMIKVWRSYGGEDYNRMCESARERAACFSLQRMAGSYEKIYSSIINKS